MQMLSSAHHVDFYERARASFGEDGARGGSEGGDGSYNEKPNREEVMEKARCWRK